MATQATATATKATAPAAAAAAGTQLPAQTDSKPPSRTRQIHDELEALKPQIELVLPQHVGVDKFMRISLTAIQQNPDLLAATRKSLFAATMRCAQDGLIPDGREAAFVIFNQKIKDPQTGKDSWVKAVQYMPMIFGVMKKIRQSGELASFITNVVYEKDEFKFFVDDAGEHILHEPNLKEARGKLLAVYAIAKTKDGGIYTEVMTREQIEVVRNVSRSKDKGPWVDWYDEMARKTVARRLSKRLPMSADIEQVLRRDDSLYDMRRPGTTPATSGRDATRALLGLTAGAADAPLPPIEGSATDAGDDDSLSDVVPQFSEDSALAEIRAATTQDKLQALYQEIVQDFTASNRDLPDSIEPAYKDRLEALKQI